MLITKKTFLNIKTNQNLYKIKYLKQQIYKCLKLRLQTGSSKSDYLYTSYLQFAFVMLLSQRSSTTKVVNKPHKSATVPSYYFHVTQNNIFSLCLNSSLYICTLYLSTRSSSTFIKANQCLFIIKKCRIEIKHV